MPRNGSGTYTLPAGNPVVTGTTISSTWANTTLSDIGTSLTNSIAKDGQTKPTANLPMNSFKHTGVAVAAATTDYARADQVQNSSLSYLTSVSGADTITASAPISLAAYAAGQQFRFIAAGANTGAVTLNINGIGAKSVTKNGATALAAGDIPNAAVVEVTYDGTQFQVTKIKQGTASVYDVGTSANNVVQLNGSAKLPAVDGSLLTGINTTQIQPVSAVTSSNTLVISASALSLDFRSTTLGSGTVTRVSGTPSNLVISSGSTLGTTSGVQSDIAVLAINNAGTIELAAANMSGISTLSESSLISTTAEGGAGGADSATTIYSTTARTNVAYRVIGIIRSTQATAGTWATAPSLIQGSGGQYLPSIDARSNIVNGGYLASSSGTTKDWTAIPPWAKRVTVQLVDVSLDASTDLLIQIGRTGTALATSGYESSSCVTGIATTTSTAGFNVYATSASKLSGIIFIERFSNTSYWISSHALSNYVSNSPTGGGRIDIGGAGTIDKLRVTSVSGTANFDGGFININWE